MILIMVLMKKKAVDKKVKNKKYSNIKSVNFYPSNFTLLKLLNSKNLFFHSFGVLGFWGFGVRWKGMKG